MLSLTVRTNLISGLITTFMLCSFSPASAGPYLDSAHGDTTAGVNRSGMEVTTGLGYTRGNCAHCHEQHASIEGTEPSPTGGPDNYALFYDNFVNQTDGLCLQCHVASGGEQIGNIVNRSYSYRAGGWTSDTVNDILTAFSFTIAPASSHDLSAIQTLLDGNWGYTTDSNPCTACHNPHAVQGDPLNSPNSPKTSTRGWPISRPSEHTNSPWDLWGNNYTSPGAGNGERMDNYTANYQAPFRSHGGTPASLEPIGDPIASPATAASNTTDFVTFCLDCHVNAIGGVSAIDWSSATGDIHGARARTATFDKGTVQSALSPYTETSATTPNYVLSCLDCHEPHGSPSFALLRAEVNGIAITQPVDSTNLNNNAAAFCGACHTVTSIGTGNPCGSPGSHSSYSTNGDCFVCHGHGFSVCGPEPNF
jgi:predicted CXXCH cytochrome family protein